MAKPRPFRLTALEPSEHDIQRAAAAFLDVALLARSVHFAVDHGAGRMTATAALGLQARGGKRGIPDHFIFDDGRVLLLEFKTRIGRLSQEQRAMHERLAAAGIAVHVCRSVDDVIAVLRAAGVPMRAGLLPSGAVLVQERGRD